MPKQVYTEKDIEDLISNGVTSLKLDDNVLLTQMAYEMAHRLGLHLSTDLPDQPPSAPIRPYLSRDQPVQSAGGTAALDSTVKDARPKQRANSALAGRIRTAVVARLGDQVDSQLLDAIIVRVLKSTGLK